MKDKFAEKIRKEMVISDNNLSTSKLLTSNKRICSETKIRGNTPQWCEPAHNKDNLTNCCRCGKNNKIKFQEGDGKRIHSLCEVCLKCDANGKID